MEYNIHGFH